MSDASEPGDTASAQDPHDDHEVEERSGLRELMSSPAHVAFFVGCVVVGATLSYLLIEGDLSAPRRIVGGALLGGFGWLLAMVHRII